MLTKNGREGKWLQKKIRSLKVFADAPLVISNPRSENIIKPSTQLLFNKKFDKYKLTSLATCLLLINYRLPVFS